jgi:antitoxin component YwqK of YwqJK toxin-antitoxin module
MKKLILTLAIAFVFTAVFAQKEKKLKLNEETNLIEATYYHDNGLISQEGTFNLERKLHGEWVSYNEEGEKVSLGTYNNGIKTGKWFFWDKGMMKEVEFSDNAITSVINRESTKGITKNK